MEASVCFEIPTLDHDGPSEGPSSVVTVDEQGDRSGTSVVEFGRHLAGDRKSRGFRWAQGGQESERQKVDASVPGGLVGITADAGALE